MSGALALALILWWPGTRQERQIKQSHDEAMRKVNNEKETLTKTNAGLQRKHSQMQHELKRKELELQKVSDRLGMLLSDKKKAEAKANVELDKALKRSTAAPVAASVPPGARRGKVDDEMYKMIVSAYEAKQKELLQENADLKKSMSALQVCAYSVLIDAPRHDLPRELRLS